MFTFGTITLLMVGNCSRLAPQHCSRLPPQHCSWLAPQHCSQLPPQHCLLSAPHHRMFTPVNNLKQVVHLYNSVHLYNNVYNRRSTSTNYIYCHCGLSLRPLSSSPTAHILDNFNKHLCEVLCVFFFYCLGMSFFSFHTLSKVKKGPIDTKPPNSPSPSKEKLVKHSKGKQTARSTERTTSSALSTTPVAATPEKSAAKMDEADVVLSSLERKSSAYRSFMMREPPQALGSKEIPKVHRIANWVKVISINQPVEYRKFCILIG